MVLTYSSYSKLKKGDPAPEFELKGVDGKKHCMKEFRGKITLVVFMCNHCPYVQPKFSYLNELQEKFKGNVKVIGINSNSPEIVEEDSFEKMKEYAKKNAFKFLYLIDETQETAKSFGAVCTPDPFLFNEKHELVYHGRLDDAHMQEHTKAKTKEIEEAIEQLIQKKEVSVEEKPSMGCSIKWK
jgi:peroxiredoxin